jgi:transcriptional regulator with XRE-family HTH domain
MKKYQQEFVTNLKYLRHAKGFSQAQFAEACGVSTGTIGNIECGIAKPSFDLIITMAEVLDVQPADFFATSDAGTDSPAKNMAEEHKFLKEIYSRLKIFFEN